MIDSRSKLRGVKPSFLMVKNNWTEEEILKRIESYNLFNMKGVRDYLVIFIDDYGGTYLVWFSDMSVIDSRSNIEG